MSYCIVSVEEVMEGYGNFAKYSIPGLSLFNDLQSMKVAIKKFIQDYHENLPKSKFVVTDDFLEASINKGRVVFNGEDAWIRIDRVEINPEILQDSHIW